jgi:pimeloyl-ACP methyl ester carboxylesterase
MPLATRNTGARATSRGAGHGLPEQPHLDGVQHRFVDLPDLRMHVAEAGRGEPVLLLHGFPQHWWEWRGVIPGLAERYRVICPDLRGAGWTDAPPAGYSRGQLLADVVALLDALNLDRVHLVAHDWGALIGFQLCLNHPGRVQRHLSLSVPHPYSRLRPGLISTLPHAWYQLAVVLPVLGPRLLSEGRQRLPRHLFNHFASDPTIWSDEDLELFLAPLRDAAVARAGAKLYRDFIQPEAIRILGGSYRDTRLTTPTRLLLGADDVVVRSEFLDGHEAHADDLAVEVVDGASHWIVDERPDVVLERALEFFARA